MLSFALSHTDGMQQSVWCGFRDTTTVVTQRSLATVIIRFVGLRKTQNSHEYLFVQLITHLNTTATFAPCHIRQTGRLRHYSASASR